MLLIFCCACQLQAENEQIPEITSRMIIVSTTTNINVFDKTVRDFSSERKWLVEKLQITLLDPKASNLGQCEAAYFLGELRTPDAVESLASKITLRLDATRLIITHLPSMTKTPALEALVKIGSPSIPVMVRNLAESDDTKARELSLQALYQIERDKDIVQLRLQKALKAESNTQRQARLQAALKSLVEIN